jgi:hypothetical protein
MTSAISKEFIGISLAATFLLLAGCVKSHHIALESESHPQVDFTGSWQLDYRLSEDLYEKIETLQRIAISNAQSRAVPVPGSRGPVIMVNQRPVNTIRAIFSLGQMADLMSRTTVLEIDQNSEQIEISRKDEFPLTCSFYGGTAVPIADALGTELCGWDYHQLIFRIDLPDGFIIHHRITLAPEGDKLNIATTVRSRNLPQPFTLNRVYQKFVPLPSEFECETTVSKGKSCRRASP